MLNFNDMIKELNKDNSEEDSTDNKDDTDFCQVLKFCMTSTDNNKLVVPCYDGSIINLY